MCLELMSGGVVFQLGRKLLYVKLGKRELCWADGHGISTAKRWLWVPRWKAE